MADINKTATEVADILMTVDNATNGGVNTLVTSANIDDIPSNKIEKPSTEGSNGQVLTTNGAGGVSWTDKLNSTELTEAVSDWLDENVDPTGAAVIVDSTLTISGAAADAKVTGDELGTLRSALNDISNDIYLYDEMPVSASANSYRLNESDGLCHVDADYKLVKFQVTAGDYIKVISNDRFQFQTVASVPASGSSNRVGETYTSGTYLLQVPQTATYLAFSALISGGIADAFKTVSKIDNIEQNIHNDTQYLNIDEWLDHKYWNSSGTMSTSGAAYNYHAYPSINLKAGTYYVYECADAYSFKKVNGTVESLGVTQLNYSPYRGYFTLATDAEVMITASPSHADTSIMMLVDASSFPSDASHHAYNVYFGDIAPLLSNSIVVDQNGHGDFTNIQDAIDSITGDSPTARFNIVVMPGTYPTFETKATGAESWSERYINIIGVDVDNTIVASDVGLYSKCTKTRLNGVVKNITFKMTNENQGDVSQESYSYAYAVHPDFGIQHTRFENCKFYSTNGPAVGFGLAENNSFLEFVNCYFECNKTTSVGSDVLGALFGHSTTTPNTTGMKLELNNCICYNKTGENGLEITQLDNTTSQSFIATNCVFLGSGGASIDVSGTWDKVYSGNNNVVI